MPPPCHRRATDAGARASFDDEPPASSLDTTDRAPSTAGTRWDETHKRWTVWLSVDLADATNAAIAARGKNRSSLVEAILRADPTIAEYL